MSSFFAIKLDTEVEMIKNSENTVTLNKKDYEEIMEFFCDAVNQGCHCEGPDSSLPKRILDSRALSSYAGALRLLARLGYVEIIEETGRRIIAKWIEKEIPNEKASSSEKG